MAKMKQIGWVVRWRDSLDEQWFAHPFDIRRTKQEARYVWCEFDWHIIGVRRLKKGFSEVVKVYIEEAD